VITRNGRRESVAQRTQGRGAGHEYSELSLETTLGWAVDVMYRTDSIGFCSARETLASRPCTKRRRHGGDTEATRSRGASRAGVFGSGDDYNVCVASGQYESKNRVVESFWPLCMTGVMRVMRLWKRSTGEAPRASWISAVVTWPG
jgi:hypothetical protein